MILVIIYIGIYLSHTVIALWSMGRLKAFISTTPMITDENCLQRYKTLVRTQMYLALIIIPILLLGGVISVILTIRHGITGLGFVLLANAWLFGMSMYHKRWEDRVRSLKASSDSLMDEYQKLSKAWVKKVLPIS